MFFFAIEGLMYLVLVLLSIILRCPTFGKTSGVFTLFVPKGELISYTLLYLEPSYSAHEFLQSLQVSFLFLQLFSIFCSNDHSNILYVERNRLNSFQELMN